MAAAAIPDNNANNANNAINTKIIPHIYMTLPVDKIPVIVYVAIGSAAQTRELDGSVIDSNYQQFPETLRMMFMSSDKCDIYIILIDPFLEDNPYVTTDKNLQQKLSINSFNYNNDYDVYTSNNVNKNIYVYPIRRDIFIGREGCPEKYDDITESIINLDELTKSENIFMSVCYFTGAIINDVATKYCEKYQETNITFGFNRQDHGCYVDLVNPLNQYIFKLIDGEHRKRFVVFDIYDYIKRQQNINYIIEYFGIEYIELIQHQIKMFIDEIWSKFNNDELWFLRIVYRLRYQCNENALDLIKDFNVMQTHYIKLFNIHQKIQINKFIIEKNYNDLFLFVINIYATYFDNIQCITNFSIKGNVLTGYQIMKYILRDRKKVFDITSDFDQTTNPYDFGTNIRELN